MLMGVSFVVSAYLQVVRHYDAIQTGVIFTAATVGLLASSLAAERLAKRYPAATAAASGPAHRDDVSLPPGGCRRFKVWGVSLR